MTRIRLSCFGIVLLLVLPAPAWAAGEAGERLRARRGAARSRGRSSRRPSRSSWPRARSPSNQAYVDRAMTLRRIVGLRRYVASNQPSDRWTKAVTSLHLFYVQNDMPQVALRPGADGAPEVAECDDRRHGRRVPSGPGAERRSREPPRHVLGLVVGSGAAARDRPRAPRACGRRARTIAGKPLPAEATPGTLYDAARVRALLGESDQALAT